MPYAKSLESNALPKADDIVMSIKKMLNLEWNEKMIEKFYLKIVANSPPPPSSSSIISIMDNQNSIFFFFWYINVAMSYPGMFSLFQPF